MKLGAATQTIHISTREKNSTSVKLMIPKILGGSFYQERYFQEGLTYGDQGQIISTQVDLPIKPISIHIFN